MLEDIKFIVLLTEKTTKINNHSTILSREWDFTFYSRTTIPGYMREDK